MPKIDPITGCTVMTIPEFWAAEAQSEGQGRSGADLAQDFAMEMEENGKNYYENLAKAANLPGLKTIFTRLAEDEQVELIAMGTHGRTGLPRALMGSVAEEVLRRAPCPVLTVRARQKQAD